MTAQVLQIADFSRLDRRTYPLPGWVTEKGLLAIHSVPKGLNAILEGQFGDASSLVAHCSALSRIYGLASDDWSDFFAAIAEHFGAAKWRDEHANEIARFLDAPGLNASAAETVGLWQGAGTLNVAARETIRVFAEKLVARHRTNWLPRVAVIKHATLLVNQARSWSL